MPTPKIPAIPVLWKTIRPANIGAGARVVDTNCTMKNANSAARAAIIS
jgi:hypothetical protein